MRDTDSADDAPTGALPGDVVEEAERLTRLARAATDPGERAAHERRRDELVADHDFVARVRRDDVGETLVLHPAEWVEDGTIVRERVEDVDRAVERSLSGPGDPERWETVDEHNRDLAATVRETHGEVHGENAAALATFMSNHYAKRIDAASGDELREFLEEYFPRNAWPTAEQESLVGRSVELVFEAADQPLPAFECEKP
jgi:hypothetical protein